MMKRKKRIRLPGVRAWTWQMDDGLCYWAQPRRDTLLAEGKPSPEAKPVLVRLVPEVELRRLLSQGKRGGK